MQSGNLNFLEPSGPLQACNGNALPFYVPVYNTTVYMLLRRLLDIWPTDDWWTKFKTTNELPFNHISTVFRT